MPKWGLSMKEGTVMAWLVEEGAAIAVGVPILEVETDKIANAVEAPDPGTLRRKVAQDGETLPVKALLGVMAGPGSATPTSTPMWRPTSCRRPSEGEDEAAPGLPVGRRGRPAHPLRAARAGGRRAGAASCTASAATSTTGCSTSMPSREDHR